MAVTNEVTFDARVLREARSLIAAGHHVSVIGVVGRSSILEEILDDILIIRVPLSYTGSVFRLSTRKFFEAITAFFRYGGPTQKRMLNKLLLIDADVYHAHDLDTLQITAIAARRKRCPFIYDAHEIYTETINQSVDKTWKVWLAIKVAQSWLTRIESKLIKRAAVVITVNQSVAQWFAREYKIPTPIVVMNAPEITTFEKKDWPQLLSVPVNTKIILYQGTFRSGMGIMHLLASAQYYPADLKLVFIGFGPLENQMKAYIADHHLKNKIILFGAVAPDLLLSYTAGADIGMAPVENYNLSKR